MKGQKFASKEKADKLRKVAFEARFKKLKKTKGAVSKKEFYKIMKEK